MTPRGDDGRQLVRWLEQAEARWRHHPPGPERDLRVQRTMGQIRDESELIAIHLPALDRAEREDLLEEALSEVRLTHGWPRDEDPHDQELFDWRVDDLFWRLELAAREQAASPQVRAKLIGRRLARRWGLR